MLRLVLSLRKGYVGSSLSARPCQLVLDRAEAPGLPQTKAPVVRPSSAGSGPMYPFAKHLALPIVGVGCGYPGSRSHSEHLRLDDFKGIECSGCSSVTWAHERDTVRSGGVPLRAARIHYAEARSHITWQSGVY